MEPGFVLWRRTGEIWAAISTDNGAHWPLQTRPHVLFRRGLRAPSGFGIGREKKCSVEFNGFHERDNWNGSRSVQFHSSGQHHPKHSHPEHDADAELYSHLDTNHDTDADLYSHLDTKHDAKRDFFDPHAYLFSGGSGPGSDVDARDLLDLIRGLNTESDTADLNGDEVTDIKDLFFFGLWWAEE